MSCCIAPTPFPSNFTTSLSSAPANALPDISDINLIPKYQCVVGCLLYLAIVTHPDLSYYAMWLGQFNANPTCAHFLLAKHVLCYLAGTLTLALCLGIPFSAAPLSLKGFMQIWVAWMLIGHLIRWIGRVSLDILFISWAPLSCGRLSSRNQLPYHRLRLNIMP